MTVAESIRVLADAGAEISIRGDRIRVAVPEAARSSVETALGLLREHRAEAVALLGHGPGSGWCRLHRSGTGPVAGNPALSPPCASRYVAVR